MKIKIGYDEYMEKTLLECFSFKNKNEKIVIIHILGFSITIIKREKGE